MNAKVEAEDLMNELFDLAEKVLKQYGEFHPFGGYLNDAKQVVHVGVDPKESAARSEKDRLDLLVSEFKSIAREERGIAFGLVTNVSLPKDGGGVKDAIKFFLEHKEGYCAEVFFVYSLAPRSNVKIVDTFAQAGTPIFFIDRPAPHS